MTKYVPFCQTEERKTWQWIRYWIITIWKWAEHVTLLKIMCHNNHAIFILSIACRNGWNVFGFSFVDIQAKCVLLFSNDGGWIGDIIISYIYYIFISWGVAQWCYRHFFIHLSKHQMKSLLFPLYHHILLYFKGYNNWQTRAVLFSGPIIHCAVSGFMILMHSAVKMKKNLKITHSDWLQLMCDVDSLWQIYWQRTG